MNEGGKEERQGSSFKKLLPGRDFLTKIFKKKRIF